MKNIESLHDNLWILGSSAWGDTSNGYSHYFTNNSWWYLKLPGSTKNITEPSL